MKIRSIFVMLFAAAALFLTQTACIEVTTETTLNADGTGTQAITMDMAKIIGQMGAMMFEGEEPTEELFAEKMGAEMMGKMDSMSMAVDTIDGISNFNSRIEGYSVTYSFDFDSFDDMEKIAAMSEQGGLMGGAGSALSLVEKGSKATLSWESSMDDLKKGMGSDGKEINDEMLTMMKGMFEGMDITSIYHVPGAIKKVSDKDHMKISKDKRTVIYQASMVDFLDGKLPAENSFTFKKAKK